MEAYQCEVNNTLPSELKRFWCVQPSKMEIDWYHYPMLLPISLHSVYTERMRMKEKGSILANEIVQEWNREKYLKKLAQKKKNKNKEKTNKS